MWDCLAQISNNNSCDAKSCSLLHFQHWFQSSCWDFCHSQTLERLSATHPRSFLSCWGIVSAILNLFTCGGQTGVVSVTVQSLSVTWLKVWSATKLPERSYCAKKKQKTQPSFKRDDRSEGERASVLPYLKFKSVHSVLLCLKHCEEPAKFLGQIIIFHFWTSAVVFVSFWEYGNCAVETIEEVPWLMASFPPPG